MPDEKPAVSTANEAPQDFGEYTAWKASQREFMGDEHGAESEDDSEAPAGETGQEAESAEDAEASGEEEHDEGEEAESDAPKGKRKSGYQRKIDKLTKRNYDLEARIAELEGKVSPESDKPATEKPAKAEKTAEGKPKVEDFEDYDQYVEAVADWKADQREKAKADKQAEETAKAEGQAAAEAYLTKQEAVRKAHADYDEALEAVEDIKIPFATQDIIMRSEVGPEVAYYLAKHPEDLKRIAQLGPVAAAREIGKIEAGLAKPPSKSTPEPRKKISSAPKPVTPVSAGRSASTPSVYDEDTASDYNAWERARRAQLKRK